MIISTTATTITIIGAVVLGIGGRRMIGCMIFSDSIGGCITLAAVTIAAITIAAASIATGSISISIATCPSIRAKRWRFHDWLLGKGGLSRITITIITIDSRLRSRSRIGSRGSVRSSRGRSRGSGRSGFWLGERSSIYR